MKYQDISKNCFMFYCGACTITDQCPDENEDDNANRPDNYFVILSCGHCLHRECAKSIIENKKLLSFNRLDSKYIKSIIMSVECPMCRNITFVYF